MSNDNLLKPNESELMFLQLAYNSFYDLYELYFSWAELNEKQKYDIILKIYSIFSECLKYEPIKHYLSFLEKNRPEWDIISLKFFEIIRHIIIHFPFFNSWNEVYFNRKIILWSWNHSKIDKFFIQNEWKEQFKWRIWDNYNKKMDYWYTINFPKNYSKNENIYLKDLIDENLWVEFSLIMIKKVLDTQVENKN